MTKNNLHIGTSGYYYSNWFGPFYPSDMPTSKMLEFYTTKFSTVELNSTFYHIPKPATIKGWILRTPQDFLWTIKVNRSITHIHRLKNITEPLKKFLELIEPVYKAGKLGVLLYQLPPSLKYDLERLSNFLKLLPRRYRHAVEFRNKSWFTEKTFDLLQRFKVGYCIASMPGWDQPVRATTDFAYFRFHGPTIWFASDYSLKELKKCALYMRRFLRQGLDVFAYFNNDVNAYATKNAAELIGLCKP